MAIRCLIVDDVDAAIFQYLDRAGISYVYQPEWPKEKCIQELIHYEGLIIRSKFKVDQGIIESCPKLQFIARAGAGVDNIDKDFLTGKGIALFHASEGNRIAVGEQTVGLILALLNNIVKADKEVRNDIWLREENRGYELASMTVGIIGYGNMGRETSKRLSAFGCKIIAYDKFRRNYASKHAEQVSLDVLQNEADIISLHIPLDEYSKGWVDKKFFNAIAKPFWLINTARGEVVKLNDLVEALKSGKVRGAALDVLENEKLSTLTEEQKIVFKELKANKQVILTPHIAGWTFESYRKISEVLGEKIIQWHKNKVS